MQVYFCQGPGALISLSVCHQPSLRLPPPPSAAKGPQPGASSPCLSLVVGVPVPASVSQMGLGPALQRAALPNGALSPVPELVVQTLVSHSRAALFCSLHSPSTEEPSACYLPEMPGGFQVQKHFKGCKPERTQMETGLHFL